MKLVTVTLAMVLVLLAGRQAGAQTLGYPDPTLHYIYPAGGQRGQTVQVEMGPLPTLNGARDMVIDGPPGISVSNIKRVGDTVGATFTIAPDAPPGRREVRVRGGASGLTNFRYFFVGQMPEVLEKEPNDTPSAAQPVVTPLVINGRIGRDLDIDCFTFRARAGQRIVAAMLAYGIDSSVNPSANRGSQGYLDANLELLDEQGRLLASCEDALGLDPLIEHSIKTDGLYTLRVQSLGHKGAPTAVYRLTVGNTPYPTHLFPPGGQRGQQVDVEIGGLNLPAEARSKINVPAEGSYPLIHVALGQAAPDGRDLPFLRGEFPEMIEAEPNNDRQHANRINWPITINGRFSQAADEDWYTLSLKKGQGVLLEVTAQRYLRSPIDSLLEVYDGSGKKLAENDDGRLFARPNHCAHDFSSADSWLTFTAPQEGPYFVRNIDQNGGGSPRAVYRLSVSEAKPDFILYQWPDAVPIWGPGTTATFIVEIYQIGVMTADLELRVEGLPQGWVGSTTRLSASAYALQPPGGLKALLTITAPPDAPLATAVPFRVFGKAVQDGRTIEHEAQYLTLYGNSHNDGMWLRSSPIARAVVADFRDCWLETSVKELTARPGETIHIPVKIHRRPGVKADVGVVVNGPTNSAGCGMRPPLALKPDQNEVLIPLTIAPGTPPSLRGIVVARSWASDTRQGRPGPCTGLIQLRVVAAK